VGWETRRLSGEVHRREGCNRVLPGQYFDAETGNHYNYFRDYDPRIGRYVESDLIGLEGGPNTYGYSASSPTIKFDLYGLLITVVLNGVSRDPMPQGDAIGISNFSSAATLAGASGIAAGAGLAAGGGAGATVIGEIATAAGGWLCRAAKELKDPCKYAILAAAIGSTYCEGKGLKLNTLRRNLESRDEIRRASEAASRGNSRTQSSAGP
jgi:RHS repeat-associated protein